MKKTPFLVILLGILSFSLTQNCTFDWKQPKNDQARETVDTIKKPGKKIYEHKETVTIYMASVKLIEENGDTTYHLALFDANGDFAVDTLTTLYLIGKDKPGNFKWKKVQESGIKKIVSIQYTGEDPPVIFKNGVKETSEDEWDLSLTEDVMKTIGNANFREKYSIVYLRMHADQPDTIDPYLRVTP